jgi:hypothetical protein
MKSKHEAELDTLHAEIADLKAKNDSLVKRMNAPEYIYNNELRDAYFWTFAGCFALLYLAFRLFGKEALLGIPFFLLAWIPIGLVSQIGHIPIMTVILTRTGYHSHALHPV